jgi:predicted DCC family thiol-disulfide oxidoreductase YuxK
MAEVVPNAVRARAGAMVGPVRAPLILFDGVCNLCNAWVRFVIRRDPTGIFRFAAQQSPVGQAVIEDHVRGAGQLSSIVLIADGRVYTESDAILQIFARLGPPCSWISFLRIIPRRVRDACYRFIVRHRYQWFGRTEVCQVPSADIGSRFIE